MKARTYIIGCTCLVAIIGLSGFFWYQSTLNQASADRENASSRQIEVSQIIDSDQSVIVSEGSFVRLDPVHEGSGQARMLQSGEDFFVELADNFEVADGPDLYVWLVKEQDLGGSVGGVNTDPSAYLDLGPLTENQGLQKFSITKEEAEEFNYAVVIWCRAFEVHFTNAVLQPIS